MANVENFTVTTAVQRIAAPQGDRTSLWIQNTHAANNLWVSPSSDVGLNNGWLIRPYGHISINKWDGDEPDKAYYAYASAAGTVVSVLSNYGVQVIEVNVTVSQDDGIQDPEPNDPVVVRSFQRSYTPYSDRR